MVLLIKSMTAAAAAVVLDFDCTLIFVNAVSALVSAFDLVCVFANLVVAKLIELHACWELNGLCGASTCALCTRIQYLLLDFVVSVLVAYVAIADYLKANVRCIGFAAAAGRQ